MQFKKFVNYVAIATIIAGLGVGATGATVCHNTDHLTHYCPLNNIFGIEHQINKVNHDYITDGIQAYKIENGTVTLKTAALIIQEEDGRLARYLPEGFKNNNGEYEKEITVPFSGEIAITEGTPIFPEGAKPGDIVRRKDIGVLAPELIRVISRPGQAIEPTEDMYDETKRQKF